jgi:hypothetical protein
MEKLFFYSSSDREKARDDGVDSSWFTVVDELNSAMERADVNPWNGDAAIIRKKYRLFNDCLVSIRPARSSDGVGKQEYSKGKYFVEIEGNCGGEKLSSRRVYLWSEALEIASLFEGLAFEAASRVWKAKKF